MRILVSLVLLLLCAGNARADDFDRLYAEGVELRRRHQDLDALDRFQRAHALRPTPRTQAQIGFAEQALGRWADAERDLKTALASADPWIEKNRLAIDRALANADEHLGTLQIEGKPDGAEVHVDGIAVGKLPLERSLRVPSGMISVELRAAGYAPGLRTVPISAQKTHRERVDLVALAATVATVDKPHDRRLWLPGWSLIGAGAGLFVVGFSGIGVRESAAAEWNSNTCTGGGGTRLDNCSGTLDAVNLGERLTIAGFVAGGLLVVGGIALLATDAVRRRR